MNILKRNIIIKVVCILIIVGLCIAIYEQGKVVSCDKCTIGFSQTRKSGVTMENPLNFDVKVKEMDENLKKGTCIVLWSRTNGYYNFAEN
jgi:hypothetical protein